MREFTMSEGKKRSSEGLDNTSGLRREREKNNIYIHTYILKQINIITKYIYKYINI